MNIKPKVKIAGQIFSFAINPERLDQVLSKCLPYTEHKRLIEKLKLFDLDPKFKVFKTFLCN